MFTGIIQELGTVLNCRATTTASELWIGAPRLVPGIKTGDSIAVNGVCLTAAALGEDWFQADVMPATWRHTNLNQLKSGDRVNLEPALTLNDRLGGHLVSGHVDGVGKVTKMANEENAVLMTISVLRELTKFLAVKGSVAVNGISLTIQALTGSEFTISLIPHTMKETNLHLLRPDAPVNVEVDLMARYMARLIEFRDQPELNEEFLARHGFIR